MIFEKSGSLSEKVDHSQFLAITGCRRYATMTCFKNVMSKRLSADKNLLGVTFIEEIEKDVLKKIESDYQEVTYKCAFLDDFPVSVFRSQLPNTKMDSRVAAHKDKNVNWDID